MAKTTAIEIDGRHIRSVTVNSDSVLDFDEIVGDDLEAALAKYVKAHGKPNGSTVISWSGYTTVRPAELPQCPDEILPAVIRDTAPSLMQMAGMVVAGVVSGESTGKTRPGMIGATEIRALEPLYKAFGADARVMLSSFAFTEDGVYLAIRAGGVEMSQVEKGYLNAARTLEVEGIDTVAAKVQQPGADASTILEDYSERVVNQVRETLRQWARDARTTSTNNLLFIHGVGADTPGIRDALTAATARQVIAPPIPGVNLSAVNAREHRAAQALFAATSGAANLPAVWLRNPVADAEKLAQKQREKQRQRLIIAGIAAILVLAFIAYPLIGARRGLSNAKGDYSDIAAEFATLADADRIGFQVADLGTQIEGIEANEPNWSAVIQFILDNTPPTVTLDTFGLSQDGRTVSVAVTMTDRTVTDAFASPEQWASDLIRELGVPGAFPKDLSRSKDGVTGSFTIPLPDDERFFYVSANPDPTATTVPEATAPAATDTGEGA